MTDSKTQNNGLFSIKNRLLIIPVIAAIALAWNSFSSLTSLKDNMVSDRITKLESLIDAVDTAAISIYDQHKAGEMSLTEAKQEFHTLLHRLRYDDGEYFFAYETNGVNFAHAAKPSLEGKNLSNVQDPTGKYIIKDLLATSKSHTEGGHMYYMWPRGSSDEPIEKVSFVRHIAELDLIVGTGAYIDDIDAAYQAESTSILIQSGILIIATFALAYWLSRTVTVPLKAIEDKMYRISEGQLDLNISEQNRTDEIGTMAKAVEIFRQNALQVKELQDRESELAEQAKKEKIEAQRKLANQFQNAVGGLINELSTSSGDMQQSADNMSEIAERTSNNSQSAINSSGNANQNVQSVAAAAEQMSQSINEISRQVNVSANIATEATDRAQQTQSTVQTMSDEAQRIGDVVNLISDIAEQTNLLALNATIEAARAGDAGKGFAVVASEVKNLANQTARATEQISSQITSMQSITGEAVSAIEGIRQTVEQINDATTSIAAAIDEQSAATNEIVQHTNYAGSSTSEVQSAINEVGSSAKESGNTAKSVAELATKLSQNASNMRHEVDNFLDRLQA